MKIPKIVEPRYETQQAILNEIAAKLGVVAYRPEYHGEKRDNNTVLFYTADAADHNWAVDMRAAKEGTRGYSRSEARSLKTIPESLTYADCFWSFENTDWNGAGNLDYANRGKIDLKQVGWEKKLEGSIRLALAGWYQFEHIRDTGGWLEPREADEYYNDLNRERIEAFRMIHGTAFLGDVNIRNPEMYKRVRDGSNENLYEEYTGQLVYNFGCDFCIPKPDKKLADMIRQWNRSDVLPKRIIDVESITGMVDELGGIQFVWF